jgi:RNA recognition motif-containing protein
LFVQVLNVKLVTDPRTRESRGFGFVGVETPEQATACVTNLNNVDFDGRTITVEKVTFPLHFFVVTKHTCSLRLLFPLVAEHKPVPQSSIFNINSLLSAVQNFNSQIFFINTTTSLKEQNKTKCKCNGHTHAHTCIYYLQLSTHNVIGEKEGNESFYNTSN